MVETHYRKNCQKITVIKGHSNRQAYFDNKKLRKSGKKRSRYTSKRLFHALCCVLLRWVRYFIRYLLESCDPDNAMAIIGSFSGPRLLNFCMIWETRKHCAATCCKLIDITLTRSANIGVPPPGNNIGCSQLLLVGEVIINNIKLY